MTDTILIEPLSPAEINTRASLEETIRSSFFGMANALLRIKDLMLYRDHGTFDAYCRARLNFSDKRAGQIIRAMVFAEQIEASTGVALPTEAVAREAKKYGDAAADVVVAAAAAGELTAPGIQKAAERLGASVVAKSAITETATDVTRQKVYETKCAPLIQWMNEKKLTAKAALSLWDTLQTCTPIVRGDMLRLGMMNETIIRYLNDRSATDGYREIVVTKHVQFGDGTAVEILKATPAQVREFFEERRKEHIRQAAAEREAATGVQEVLLTLWINDSDRSADMLLKMMTPKHAAQIARRILLKTQPVNSLTASAVF